MHDDAAYLLGALPPAERAEYERHLAACPPCRTAMAEIAPLPGLLSRLDPMDLEQVVAPPAAESRVPALLAAADRDRRRRRRATRWRYAATALVAACLALLAGLGLGWSPEVPEPPGTDFEVRMVTMQPVAGEVPVSAEIGLNGTNWGTEVTMECRYAKTRDYTKAYTFRLVARGGDGSTEQVGSWVAVPGERVRFTGMTRFTRNELVRLELLRYDGTPLLVYDVP
ncbi:anti-sigma factor family protein [Micromonospora sonneratiae]|uniref:Anti-sigma factor family protein n=1 Tax=Micromonospora sonneratiae TaxID=1184706 RepID=A0ABW3YNJ6_9ACTN